MTAKLRILATCLMLSLLGSAGDAYGQVVQTSYSSPVVDQTTPAMRYFSRGRRPIRARPQMRRPQVAQQQSQHQTQLQTQPPAGKPFQHVSPSRPTITPYLSLDAIQTNEAIPNYYSRVLPQIEQQQATQKQQDELRRLQQQLRLASAPGLNINSRNVGVPTTGRSSQFLNNGGYFPTQQR